VPCMGSDDEGELEKLDHLNLELVDMIDLRRRPCHDEGELEKLDHLNLELVDMIALGRQPRL
jgi:hypothetical protein